MTQTLRMGVIGCGAIAQIMHIPYLAEHERFQLVSLCDAYEPVLNEVADRYHVEKRYTDYQDLLANDDLDAVVICHAGSHRDTVIGSIQAGKHVFVEKPLTWSLPETEDVADVVRQSNCILQMGYHKLYDPAFSYVKQQIEQMQDIGFVRITVLHPANELGFSPYRLRRGNGKIEEGHTDPGTLERQRAGQLQAFSGGKLKQIVDEALGDRKDNSDLRLAYGTVVGSLIHQIYTMYGLFGEPEKVISTDVWREGFSIHSVIQYPKGLRVMMDWHFLSHLKDYDEEFAIYGNHDRVMLNFPSPYFRNFPSPVTIQGGDGELSWKKEVTVSHGEAFENELLAFYDNVVNNQTPVLSSIEDAVKHARFQQEMIDAVRL
jgi:predicted dehydrogenase